MTVGAFVFGNATGILVGSYPNMRWNGVCFNNKVNMSIVCKYGDRKVFIPFF